MVTVTRIETYDSRAQLSDLPFPPPLHQAKTKEMGVPLNYLRSPVNARYHVNWRGYGGPVQDLPSTDAALAAAYDLKLPPHFDDEDFDHIAKNIAYAARMTVRAGAEKN